MIEMEIQFDKTQLYKVQISVISVFSNFGKDNTQVTSVHRRLQQNIAFLRSMFVTLLVCLLTARLYSMARLYVV